MTGLRRSPFVACATLAVIAALLATALPSQVHGALCIPGEVKKENAVDYIGHLIGAFRHAKDARDRTKGLDETNSDVLDLMIALKSARKDFECAESFVRDYGSSSNRAIRVSALGTVAAFENLGELQERALREMRAALDAIDNGDFDRGAVLESQADIASANDDAWKSLIPAAIAATYAIVEEDEKTGTMSRLTLTVSERDRILGDLRDAFGTDVTMGMKPGQHALLFAAAAIYEVVAARSTLR